jgi:hypothetical protein
LSLVKKAVQLTEDEAVSIDIGAESKHNEQQGREERTLTRKQPRTPKQDAEEQGTADKYSTHTTELSIKEGSVCPRQHLPPRSLGEQERCT